MLIFHEAPNMLEIVGVVLVVVGCITTMIPAAIRRAQKIESEREMKASYLRSSSSISVEEGKQGSEEGTAGGS
jgi:hypothetical protein